MRKPQVILAKIQGDMIGFESLISIDGPVPRVFSLGEHPEYSDSPYINSITEYNSLLNSTSGTFQIDINVALETKLLTYKQLEQGTIN